MNLALNIAVERVGDLHRMGKLPHVAGALELFTTMEFVHEFRIRQQMLFMALSNTIYNSVRADSLAIL